MYKDIFEFPAAPSSSVPVPPQQLWALLPCWAAAVPAPATPSKSRSATRSATGTIWASSSPASLPWPTPPTCPDHEYVAVLVTAVNRSGATTFNIGAQNLAELDAAYPLNDEATKLDVARQYFHALADSTTDFTAVCDGAEPRWALTSSSMTPPLRASPSPPICPRRRRLHPADLLRPHRLAEAERHLHPDLRGQQEPHLLSELF